MPARDASSGDGFGPGARGQPAAPGEVGEFGGAVHPGASAGATRRPPPWSRVLATCALVAGLHGLITVPPSERERSPADDDAGAGETKRKGGMGKGGMGKGGMGKRDKHKRKRAEARAFASQPRDPGFAAVHEPIVRRAYAIAHDSVFDTPAEDGLLEDHSCHRWRCQLELCGTRPELRGLLASLRTLRYGEVKLWRAFELGPLRNEPDQLCRTVTLRFTSPAPQVERIHALPPEARTRGKAAGMTAGMQAAIEAIPAQVKSGPPPQP